jgi:transposase-like protein
MDLNRKRASFELKNRILQEHFDRGTPISELARINQIHPITIYQWKRKMAEENNKSDIDLKSLLQEMEQLKKQNKQLTKALGELTLDIQCLKDINEFYKKKQIENQLKKQKNSSSKTRGNT